MTQLWQRQSAETAPILLDDVRRRADRVERVVRRRNWWGLIVCAAEVLAFGGMWIAYPDATQRLGCTMTLVGLLYMSVQLARRSAVRPAADLGLAAGLDFLRAELTRQRDFHRGAWFWSRFVLFVPGPLVFAVGSARVFPSLSTQIAVVAGVYIAIALWAIPLNRRVARGYQRALDALARAA